MNEPIAVDVAGAAQLLGVSPGLIRKLTLSGSIPSALIGSRRVYPLDALRTWMHERTEQPGSIAQLLEKENDPEARHLRVVKEARISGHRRKA